MRIEGSVRHAKQDQRLGPVASGAQPAAGTLSVGGGDSVPVLDSVVASDGGGGEAIHVDGGVAARSGDLVLPLAVEMVPLAVGTRLTFPDAGPTTADTLSGTGAGPVISLLHGGENAAAIASLRAGPPGAGPSPAGWLDDAGLGLRGDAESSGGAVLGVEAGGVAWSDPASVEGAAVLAIGAATVVLSELVWPKGFGLAAG